MLMCDLISRSSVIKFLTMVDITRILAVPQCPMDGCHNSEDMDLISFKYLTTIVDREEPMIEVEFMCNRCDRIFKFSFTEDVPVPSICCKGGIGGD